AVEVAGGVGAKLVESGDLANDGPCRAFVDAASQERVAAARDQDDEGPVGQRLRVAPVTRAELFPVGPALPVLRYRERDQDRRSRPCRAAVERSRADAEYARQCQHDGLVSAEVDDIRVAVWLRRASWCARGHEPRVLAEQRTARRRVVPC